jgi:co-chaperonin GroES (HSP10)
MATPFSVTMRPPYLLVAPSVSGEEINNVSSFGKWAEVYEINSDTIGIAVGDIIYFLENSAPEIVYKDGTTYYIVNESSVLFIEP